jgi:hypothetical protein
MKFRNPLWRRLYERHDQRGPLLSLRACAPCGHKHALRRHERR